MTAELYLLLTRPIMSSSLEYSYSPSASCRPGRDMLTTLSTSLLRDLMLLNCSSEVLFGAMAVFVYWVRVLLGRRCQVQRSPHESMVFWHEVVWVHQQWRFCAVQKVCCRASQNSEPPQLPPNRGWFSKSQGSPFNGCWRVETSKVPRKSRMVARPLPCKPFCWPAVNKIKIK